MDRRAFLTAAVTGPALAQVSTAGLPLIQLREQFQRELFDEFVPFMDRYIIDHELGGFCCHADRDGTRLSGEKVTWYQGRGVWVYAFLYNHFGRDERYLEVARKAARFLERTRPPADQFRPLKYDREGKPITPADPEVYSDLFVAEGFAEYSAATGERAYWDEAKRILMRCMEEYERPDYAADVSRGRYLAPNDQPFPGARVVGVWMLSMRVATGMLRMRADAGLEKIARRSTDAVLGPHYNREWRLNWELLNHDFTPPTNAFGRQAYLGHSMETFWMIMDEALRRKDRALFNTAAERFRRHVDVAWDHVYGGVFDNLADVDRYVWGMEKYLWAQLEVLIGALLAFQQTGAEWAGEMFSRMHAHVQERYSLKKHGLPLYMFSGDRKMTFTRHSERIENYHLPRYLMLCLIMLEQMTGKRAA